MLCRSKPIYHTAKRFLEGNCGCRINVYLEGLPAFTILLHAHSGLFFGPSCLIEGQMQLRLVDHLTRLNVPTFSFICFFKFQYMHELKLYILNRCTVKEY